MKMSVALELAGATQDEPDPPGRIGNRRGAPRRGLKLRALAQPGVPGTIPVVVHDISTRGMLIEAASGLLQQGDRLTIDLPEMASIDARVMWQGGRFSGCQFATPVASGVVSAALLKGEGASPPPSTIGDGTDALPSEGPVRFEPEVNFRAAAMLALLGWVFVSALATVIVAR